MQLAHHDLAPATEVCIPEGFSMSAGIGGLRPGRWLNIRFCGRHLATSRLQRTTVLPPNLPVPLVRCRSRRDPMVIQIEPLPPLRKIDFKAMTCDLTTKTAQSSALENIGLERANSYVPAMSQCSARHAQPQKTKRKFGQGARQRNVSRGQVAVMSGECELVSTTTVKLSLMSHQIHSTWQEQRRG